MVLLPPTQSPWHYSACLTLQADTQRTAPPWRRQVPLKKTYPIAAETPQNCALMKVIITKHHYTFHFHTIITIAHFVQINPTPKSPRRRIASPLRPDTCSGQLSNNQIWPIEQLPAFLQRNQPSAAVDDAHAAPKPPGTQLLKCMQPQQATSCSSISQVLLPRWAAAWQVLGRRSALASPPLDQRRTPCLLNCDYRLPLTPVLQCHCSQSHTCSNCMAAHAGRHSCCCQAFN